MNNRFTFFISTNQVNGFLMFAIVAQDINGRRLVLKTSEITSLSIDEHREIRDKQNRRIMGIENHIANGGTLNPEHWQEIAPAGGSPAYMIAKERGLV